MKTNIIFYLISLISSYNEKRFKKICREYQNTPFVFSDFFLKIVPFMRKCKKILQRGAGHRQQYGGCALHAGYLRLQIHTLMLCNNLCFSQQRWLHEHAPVLR